MLNAATEVEVARVTSASTGGGGAAAGSVILNATGYIVAAHKIQVASKVLGRVAWIGVDKGDKVKQGQVIARLEDDEYKAQLQQATGRLQALEARLKGIGDGLATGRGRPRERRSRRRKSRPGERQGESGAQPEAIGGGRRSRSRCWTMRKSRYDRAVAKVNGFQKSYELVKIGPRAEQIDAVRGQIVEARGSVAFFESQQNNTDHSRSGHRHCARARSGGRRVRHHQLRRRARRQGIRRLAGRPQRPGGGTRYQPERLRQARTPGRRRSSPPTRIPTASTKA